LFYDYDGDEVCAHFLFAGGKQQSDDEGGRESDEEEEGPIDSKQLAAETQRVLRGPASLLYALETPCMAALNSL